MTSGGKVRIYELSRDLGLDNRDVLEAAEKLSIAAKSHSSSISDGEAAKIRTLLKGQAAPAASKILTVKKATADGPSAPVAVVSAPAKPVVVAKPVVPAKPVVVAKPVVPAKPVVVAKP
ncbi:translation initiation factor IF-2 N-terminal domain-containing protein, partial [Synechococcus lacustris Cruz CV12-2]